MNRYAPKVRKPTSYNYNKINVNPAPTNPSKMIPSVNEDGDYVCDSEDDKEEKGFFGKVGGWFKSESGQKALKVAAVVGIAILATALVVVSAGALGPVVAGAALGAIAGASTTGIIDAVDNNSFDTDWKVYVGAAIGGAITGGAGAYATGAIATIGGIAGTSAVSTTQAAFGMMAAGGFSSTVRQYISTGEVNYWQVGADAVTTGTMFGAAATAAPPQQQYTSPNAKEDWVYETTDDVATETFLPDEAYGNRLPKFVEPGIKSLDKYNDVGNLKQTKYYDDYGRETGWTDYTDHGFPDEHSVPHWHEVKWNEQYPVGGYKVNHRMDPNPPFK